MRNPNKFLLPFTVIKHIDIQCINSGSMLNDYGKFFLYYCDSQDTVRHDYDFIQTKATWLSVDFTRKKRQVLYRNLDLQVLQRAAIW